MAGSQEALDRFERQTAWPKLAFNSGCGNGILDALQEAHTKGNIWLANNLCTSDI